MFKKFITFLCVAAVSITTPVFTTAQHVENKYIILSDVRLVSGVNRVLIDMLDAEDSFEEQQIEMHKGYTTTGVNVRKEPSKKSDKLDTLFINTEIKYVRVSKKWCYVTYDGGEGYIYKKYISNKKTKVKPTETYTWNGKKLNSRIGTIQGPSGKETYYNLPMNGVISIMTQYGYSYADYAVRSDGVKTLGGYVMVAADLNVHPRGSLVPTSLGMGLVCDTGTFTYSNHNQLDIAVSW